MSNKINKGKRLLDLVFRYPTQKFHTRRIARLLKISPPTVSKLVNLLVKEKVLLRKKTKIMDEITANFDSEEFKIKKRIHNLESLYQSGLINYLKKFTPDFIVLFGSYSRGEDIEESDIDLALPGNLAKISVNVYKKIDTYEKKLNRKINIHFIDFLEVSEEFKNSLANGITLHGYLTLKCEY